MTRRSALFFACWLLFSIALALGLAWEADRQEQLRLQAFRSEVSDLAQISEAIMASRLRNYDETLRVLREAFRADRANFAFEVERLRAGPLSERDLWIVVVDRDGELAFTDAPNPSRANLADRAYFRYFADGGKDRFYVDEPVLGRTTRRLSVPLVRPMYDAKGQFQGVVALSVRQDSLANFGPRLKLLQGAVVNVVTRRGALVNRTSGDGQAAQTAIPAALLDLLLQGSSGVATSTEEGRTRVVAYRHIEDTPLIVYVTASPAAILHATSQQRAVLLSAAGVTAALALLLIFGYLQRQEVASKLIASQQAYLREAQRIAGMGSWELRLDTRRFRWSDEVYRLYGVQRENFEPTLENFLELVSSDERAAVQGALDEAARLGRVEFSFFLNRGDGGLREMIGRAEAVAGKGGKPAALIGTVRDVTETQAARRALSQSEARYRTLATVAPVGIFRANAAGGFTYVNDFFGRLTGRDVATSLGAGWLGAVDAADRAEVEGTWRHAVEHGGKFVAEFRVARPEGGVRWLMAEAQAESDEQGRVHGYVGSVTDITEHRRAEEQLRIAAVTFESQEGMVITDADTVILRVNRAFTESTGYAPEDVIGQTPRLLKSGRHDAEFYRAMWNSIAQTGKWQGEIWDRHKSGRVYPKWLMISAVKNEAGAVTHYVGTHTDITERKEAEDKIRQLAFFDSLTGLPNRALLMDRLKQSMAASARSACYNALLFIDLDNFKALNDTQGHDQGDSLLQQIAARLAGGVREGDTVARLGGDEFVVMLSGLSSVPEEAAAVTEAVGEKLLAMLDHTFTLERGNFHCSASIGVTLFSGQAITIENLLKQADLAMYKAKDAGRNTVRFFDARMEAAVMERSALETDLQSALREGQFTLHYQPQVEGEGLMVGAEALLRWHHPQRKSVSPASFIPLAEETGLILPLGRWVLEAACRQLAAWSQMSELCELSIAVNVSARQFRHPDFIEQVLSIVAETGADPHRLKLELTESAFVDDIESTIEKMHALKAKGIRFSLDDFGTGYSSLSYLKRMPLDQLKIDRSFVRDVLTDPNDAAIARTIIALADRLGLAVIAEGVESAAQRDFLASSGCYAYQGYLFSRPLPGPEFEMFALEAAASRVLV